MDINLNLYKYFYEVAKYMSYTSAAKYLCVSQPSLSYSIKELEKQLGFKLFVRTHNKIELTDSGEELYEKLKEVFAILDTIYEKDNVVAGKITIGVRTMFASTIFPNYVKDLQKAYPNLEIDFKIGDSDDLLDMLKNNKVEMIIDEYIYDNYVSTCLKKTCSKTGFIVYNNYYSSLDNQIIDLEYLQKHKIAVVSINKVSKDIKKRYPLLEYVDLKTTPIMLNYLKSEQCVGFSVLDIIYSDIETGKFRVLKTNIKLPNGHMYVNYKKEIDNYKIKKIVGFLSNCDVDELANVKE